MQTRLSSLFKAYYEKTATVEERRELAALLNLPQNQELLPDLLAEVWENAEPDHSIILPEKAAEMLAGILYKEPAPVRMLNWWRYVAAAIIVLSLGTAAWFILAKSKAPVPLVEIPVENDISPAHHKATLTLAGGKVVTLDTASAGLLTQQGNTKVNVKDGQLTYNRMSPANAEVIYNTLATARGETYSLTLADGSVVSLNAASSIRFPVAFNGPKRIVEITGEAYFKVAKNARQPFIVHTSQMDVLAVGTAFNVNVYNDEEAPATTLVEGVVKVSTAGEAQVKMLYPAQQARLEKQNLLVNTRVNVEEVTAWKNGLFHFESADLKTILKELARWYDIEVVYEGKVSTEKFYSIMNRNSTLSSVLKALQANGVKFRIEGKKLIVQNG